MKGIYLLIVFVIVVGRSSGVSSLISDSTVCSLNRRPPIPPDWVAQGLCLSLGLSVCLGCSTINFPGGLAQFAAEIFGLNNHLTWAKL